MVDFVGEENYLIRTITIVLINLKTTSETTMIERVIVQSRTVFPQKILSQKSYISANNFRGLLRVPS